MSDRDTTGTAAAGPAGTTGATGTTTRRRLLTMMAGGAFAAAGGGFLSACSKGSGAANITLTTNNGWPYGPMPNAKDQKANPGTKAYADVLKAWLDENPGVTIKNSTLDVWNQQTLTTALTGGTAPSMFPGDVIGGWNRANVRAAMSQGLAAEVTEHLKTYKVEEKLADYVKPIWEKWAIDGKFYAAPWIYNVGTGLHYRIDLIRELGLKEPTPDWTWDDVRELAKGLSQGKRKGIALQGWGLNAGLSADGMDFHSTIPAPDTGWNWRWDYTSRADTWVPLIERMRAMIFEDKSVLADVSLGDGDLLAAFFRGDVAMHNNTVIFFASAPGGDNAPADLAKKLDKPIEEVVGWMTQPVGGNGRSTSTQGQCDLVGFSPDLDDEQLDKAISLLTYMQGPGWVKQRTATYEHTKDPKHVFDGANIMPLYKDLVDQAPSSPDEAWGKPFMDQVRRAAQIPIAPNEAFYFSPENNTGPTTTARDDMSSRWANERGNLDLRADLAKLDQTRNQQAKSFTSSRSDEEFVKSARNYYEAHDAYWKANAPEYHQNVFRDWYDNTVLPALKG
ncbi:ABC transporter substrate-binding protein [Actinopolymorpha alba]|uniref:ABC transporter substrate-binding protein n=1 Tax=Actinopolymorpha alba TaxID=533267 RepID=UPI00035EECCA|nr:ABC transporter substrate-binding protein [Actinopolymorpha alba]